MAKTDHEIEESVTVGVIAVFRGSVIHGETQQNMKHFYWPFFF